MSLGFRVLRGIILGLVLSIIPISCSSGFFRLDYVHKKNSPELERYRKTLYEISKGKLGNPDYSIGFIARSINNPNLAGQCSFVIGKMNKEIDIVKEYWQNVTVAERLLLLAHEYRHCECNYLSHTSDYYLDGCSKSYMDSFTIDTRCIKLHLNDYLNEIRKGCEI